MGFIKVDSKKAVQDGWYKAVIERIEEVEGQYGEQLLITFRLKNGVDTTRRAYLSPYIGERNKTRQFIDALGIDISTAEDVDLGDLISKELMIQLQTVDTKAGRRVQKVVAYAPVPRQSTMGEEVVKIRRVFTKQKEGGN